VSWVMTSRNLDATCLLILFKVFPVFSDQQRHFEPQLHIAHLLRARLSEQVSIEV
jgi:hypothetical protein